MVLELAGDALSEILVADAGPGWVEAPRRWPKWVGGGSLEAFEIRSGVLLWMSQLTPTTEIRLAGSRDDDFLSLSYYLRGGFRMIPDGAAEAWQMEEGHCQVSVSPGGHGGVGFFEAGKRSVIVSLSLSREAAFSLLGAPAGPRTASLVEALDGERPQVGEPRQMTAFERTIATQMVACPFIGPTRRLFLESRVLDLLVHEMARVSSPSSGPSMSSDDEGRIRAAARLLTEAADRPPSIRQLARSVGVNELKLKQGFRRIFGTTVFGYLREQRMGAAYALLANGQASVADAAQRVGYACPSRFAAAFQQRFGIAPSKAKPRPLSTDRLREPTRQRQ